MLITPTFTLKYPAKSFVVIEEILSSGSINKDRSYRELQEPMRYKRLVGQEHESILCNEELSVETLSK